MNGKKIGNRLAKLRGDKRREQVAADLGISFSALVHYELGDRIPKDEIKIKIARYYGMSVEDIFYTE